MSEVLCKDCRYFEDVKMKSIPSLIAGNVFSLIDVPYGVCNNTQNEEYRCSCWEYYHCKGGREKK